MSGTVESIILDEYITDSKWLKVPESYANQMFVVKGQNNILSGQTVNAKYENMIWKKEGDE